MKANVHFISSVCLGVALATIVSGAAARTAVAQEEGFMMEAFSIETFAAGDGDFGANEAEYIGPCRTDGNGPGSLFEWPVGDKVVTMCCPKGQYPTGNLGVNEKRCALPSRSHCDDPNRPNGVVYCLTDPPFELCCPKASITLCEPDQRKRQCKALPFPPPDGL